MKRTFILSVMTGILACGCSSNEDMYNDYLQKSDKSFRVAVEQPVCNETRAHLNNLNVVFDDKDKIAVFENNTAKSEYTYSGETFSGISAIDGEALESIYALYPHSAATTYNTGTLPAEQTYCENSFSSGSQIMYGQTENMEEGFNLKNMCGYIRLHLYGDNVFVKDITLSVTGEGEYVSGDFQIVANEDGGYSLEMNDEGNTQLSSVKMVCPDDGIELGTTRQTATVFYMALPPQTYTKGFSVTITDIFGRKLTKTAFSNGGFELKRNHIKPMEALNVIFGDDELTIVKGTDGNQYAKVGTSEQLLKWGYTLNNMNKNLGAILEEDIEMPLYTIEVNATDGTYQFTDTPITIGDDGTPSGSNWISVCAGISSLDQAFSGHIDGKNHQIKGLRISQNNNYVGFIGAMYDDASIKNLTLEDVVVKGGKETGAVAGRSHNGTLIENVHVTNSTIIGEERVGGVVGMNYRRINDKYNEKLSYIVDCTTDESTIVKGTSSQIGGICGRNDGAVILHCTNNADVTGTSCVGGVVGDTRSYNYGGINGYVIASGTTESANVTSTANNGYAGGIAGYSYHNASHTNSDSYIVACYSESNISSDHPGTMIGTTDGTDRFGTIISSWAKQTGEMEYSAQAEIPNRKHSEHYSSPANITQEAIDEMNGAISEYNNTEGVEQKCPYQWQYNAGGWPTLVKISSSNGN